MIKKVKKSLYFSVIFLTMFFSYKVQASPSLQRLGGSDRYETAVQIANAGWKESEYAVLAMGEEFPDALSAAPLAKKYNAPILITPKNALNNNVKQCLSNLKVSKVFIIGGTGVISTAIENEINDIGITTKRIAGADRYETSVAVAKELGLDYSAPNKDIYIASGDNFPDALSITPIAAEKIRPIILSPKDSLTENTKKFLQNECTAPNVYILGGTGVLSNNLFDEVKNLNSSNVKRLGGNDRFATNILIVNEFLNVLNLETINMANGENFPDALSGAAFGAKTASPMILINDSPTKDTKNFVNSNLSNVNQVNILGGSAVVKSSTLYDLHIAEKLGNTDANINNFGLAAMEGNYIYYRNDSDNGTLYRMNADGSGKKKIIGTNACRISVLNGRIYYVANSSFPAYMCSDYMANGSDGDCYVTDGRGQYLLGLGSYIYLNTVGSSTYYGQNGGLFTDTDGYLAEKRVTEGGHNYFTNGNEVYYIRESAYDSKIYKTKLNSGSSTLVIDEDVYKFNIFNNKLYYIDFNEHKLYRSNLDGSNKTLILQDKVSGINVTDGWVYYSNESDGNKLYKIKTDGTYNTKLNDEATKCINIVGDWIIYATSGGNYKMKLDGSQKGKL